MNKLRDILDQHIKSIMVELDPARAHVTALERELADAKKALSAITNPARAEVAIATIEHLRPRVFYGGGGEVRDLTPRESPYARLTMKQLIRKALDEHFENGATAIEMLDFFADAWGRNDIVRTSLSPQLSRLKREGVITLHGIKWRLADSGQENGPEDESSGPAYVGVGRSGSRLPIQRPSGSISDASTQVRGEGDGLPLYQSTDPKG